MTEGCHRLETLPERVLDALSLVEKAEMVADLLSGVRPDPGLCGSKGRSNLPAIAPTLARLARPGTLTWLATPAPAPAADGKLAGAEAASVELDELVAGMAYLASRSSKLGNRSVSSSRGVPLF